MSRIVDGEFKRIPANKQGRPYRDILRFDATDEKSPISALYIRKEAIESLTEKSSIRVTVDVE